MIAVDSPVRLFIGLFLIVALWKVGRSLTHRFMTHRLALGVLAIVVGVVIALGVASFFPALITPSSRLVNWELGDGVGGPRFDPATAQTTTMVAVGVWWPSSAPLPPDASWLEPTVAYTPWSVTITLHSRFDTCSDVTRCGAFYLSTISIPVYLSEPLGGRALFDGSTVPPAARPYP